MATLVYTLPHVGVLAAIQRDIRLIVAKRDLQQSREQSLMTAYPTQNIQALPLEPRGQGIQHLFSRAVQVNWPVPLRSVGSTSYIISTKDCASSPRRHLTASISLRSEKMAVIKEMRSSVERGRLINRFHAGVPLREKPVRLIDAEFQNQNLQAAQNLQHSWTEASFLIPASLCQCP